MGLLVNGQWRDQWYNTSGSRGRFLRKDSAYRNWVTVDGAPGPTGHGGFPAELGRYHLYVSLACPWAHRTLILRSLKGLEAIIPASVVHWRMLENGWTFEDGPGVVPDPNLGAKFLTTQMDCKHAYPRPKEGGDITPALERCSAMPNKGQPDRGRPFDARSYHKFSIKSTSPATQITLAASQFQCYGTNA